jgi:amino acid permease
MTFTASSIPQFGKILSLIGGSTVTLMTFVLPPIFYFRLSAQTDAENKWPKRFAFPTNV